jgi:hypothetical protein
VHAADIAESVRAAEDASEPKAETGRLALPDASIGFFVAPNADVGPDDDDEPAQGRAAEGDTDNEIEKVAEPVASDPQADEAGSREAGAGDAAMTADDDAELVERSEDESGEAAHVDAEPDVEREQTPAVEGAGSDVVEAAKNEPAEAEVALSEAAADEAAEMVVAAAPPSDVPAQTAGAGEDQVGASEDAAKDDTAQDAAASPDSAAAKEDGAAPAEGDEDKATRQDIEAP